MVVSVFSFHGQMAINISQLFFSMFHLKVYRKGTCIFFELENAAGFLFPRKVQHFLISKSYYLKNLVKVKSML